MTMRELMSRIEDARDSQDNWCSIEKAQTLAALVVALRPSTVCEIGVWRGASLLPQLFALRHNGSGKAIAIDPWSAEASVLDEIPENAEWWSTVDHEAAYQTLLERLRRHELAGFCEIVRARSDDAPVPPALDLLHIDGSHTIQAFRDVDRFARAVRIGGILVMDDLAWSGGGVGKGHGLAKELGFVDLYPLGTGCVMQRIERGLAAGLP